MKQRGLDDKQIGEKIRESAFALSEPNSKSVIELQYLNDFRYIDSEILTKDKKRSLYAQAIDDSCFSAKQKEKGGDVYSIKSSQRECEEENKAISK